MCFQGSLEHKFLPIPFTVLTLCGTWYPENWSAIKKQLYTVFTISIVILGIILFLEISIRVFLDKREGYLNLENIFAINVFSVGIYKKICLIRFRRTLLKFVHTCTDEEQWHQPRNSHEEIMLVAVKSETTKVTGIYATFIIVALLLRSLEPIIETGTLRVLPLEAWYPYDVNNFLAFPLTYAHQLISGITLTCMHLTSDTLFVGFLVQVRYQLDILKHRLRDFAAEVGEPEGVKSRKPDASELHDLIVERIEEQESIYRFSQELESTFKPILIGLMIFVVPNMIINIYMLSVYSNRLSLKYIMTIFFALVPPMQSCMFCWYGNEIVIGSTDIGDALYESNWIKLDKTVKKLLLTVITRPSRSILITAGAVIPLNIDSFIKIMKTSYSAFNLLRQTSAR